MTQTWTSSPGHSFETPLLPVLRPVYPSFKTFFPGFEVPIFTRFQRVVSLSLKHALVQFWKPVYPSVGFFVLPGFGCEGLFWSFSRFKSRVLSWFISVLRLLCPTFEMQSCPGYKASFFGFIASFSRFKTLGSPGFKIVVLVLKYRFSRF